MEFTEMQTISDFKAEAFEMLDSLRFHEFQGATITDKAILQLMWESYNNGYQDRIDDYDGAEDTTEQDEWERTR